MSSSFMFHIRNSHPGDMVALLSTLVAYPDLDGTTEIVNKAESLGFGIRDRQRLEALATARDLKIVEEKANSLTERGQMLQQIEMYKPDLFVDMVHGIQYSLWNHQIPDRNCFSWSYRTVCRILWESGDRELVDIRQRLASELEGLARANFGLSTIAISAKSVGGALLWLTELNPPVIQDDTHHFQRRSFCPPELFVYALDHLYQLHDVDYGANLLITDENVSEVCSMCLLELSSFDRVLDYTVAQFQFLHRGLGGGWGQYVTLNRAPDLKDVL